MSPIPYKSNVRLWNCLLFALRDLKSSWERVRLVSLSEIFAAHRKSALGAVWAYILPMVPVTAFVFIRLAIQPGDTSGTDAMHPASYAAVGVTVWFWLRDLLLAPTNAIIKHRSLISDTSFPLFGAAVSGLATVTFDTLVRIAFAIAVVMWLDGASLLGGLYFVGFMLFGGLVAFTAGLLIAPLCLVFSDFRYLVEIAMRYLIFFSFAIFPISISGLGDWLYTFNPVAVLIVNTRQGLLHGVIADPTILAIIAISFPIGLILALRNFFAAEPAIREALG